MRRPVRSRKGSGSHRHGSPHIRFLHVFHRFTRWAATVRSSTGSSRSWPATRRCISSANCAACRTKRRPRCRSNWPRGCPSWPIWTCRRRTTGKRKKRITGRVGPENNFVKTVLRVPRTNRSNISKSRTRPRTGRIRSKRDLVFAAYVKVFADAFRANEYDGCSSLDADSSWIRFSGVAIVTRKLKKRVNRRKKKEKVDARRFRRHLREIVHLSSELLSKIGSAFTTIYLQSNTE